MLWQWPPLPMPRSFYLVLPRFSGALTLLLPSSGAPTLAMLQPSPLQPSALHLSLQPSTLLLLIQPSVLYNLFQPLVLLPLSPSPALGSPSLLLL
ncbi:hypothetical protein KC19_VG308000 [Ceratodon purpureus]|uniref:Uncharacterized protein n=1 Tax=Ceratodon purpureus TaxID=3225 RepID=A0A8T0HV79_CERPU|nr:hypothetical protein KC19_VG308000 [Ceratodon purpureus]